MKPHVFQLELLPSTAAWARYSDPLIFPGMPAIAERIYRTALRMKEIERLK